MAENELDPGAAGIANLLLPLGGILDPALLLNGSLLTLGLAALAPPESGPGGFRVEVGGNLYGRYPCRGVLEGSSVVDPSTFRARLRMDGRFHELEAEVLRAVRVEVEKARSEVARASNRITAARQGVDLVLQQEVERLRLEAERRRGAADAALEEARKQVEQARANLDAVDLRVAEAREAVARDREQVDEAFRSALESLEQARARVAAVQSQVDAHNHWYHTELDDAGRFWNAAAYAVKLASLEAARGPALSALEVAQATVEAVRQARDAWHPDADPRVSAPLAERSLAQAALDAAYAALAAAEQGAAGLPEWVLSPEAIEAEAHSQVSGVTARKAQRLLRTAEQVYGDVLRLAERIEATGDLPLEIHDVALDLAPGAAPTVAADARLAVLRPDGSRSEEPARFDLDLNNLPVTAAALAARVLGLEA